MTETTWFYELKGERRGPVSEAQVEALVDAGVIDAHTRVWSELLDSWTPVFKTDLRGFLSGPIGAPPLDQSDAPPEDRGEGQTRWPSHRREPSTGAAPGAPGAPGASQDQSAPLSDMATAAMGEVWEGEVWEGEALAGGESDVAYVKQHFMRLEPSRYVTYLFFVPQILLSGLLGFASLTAETVLTRAHFYDLWMSDGMIAVTSLLFFGGMIAFLTFVYRAAQNAGVLSRTKFKPAPWACVGWYFVPVLNLWMPLKTMLAIAAVSDRWHRAPFKIWQWWLLVLGSGVVSLTATLMVESRVHLFGSFNGTLVFFAISLLAEAAAIGCAMEMMKAVNRMQSRHRDEILETRGIG
ncbi:DUF4328 domain-containing protein [Roseovarius nubinhibens]|uniref:GYF domain-containing protein n=1 Tax=Roseovarius nubinhibens (strain ATCC BAA-591 / DSM 15170 / ISM) TaxID=89187 RepID=A3SI00_ROSNI|nr:DUF4328 domain-containing protein [Roseovarius nubinhibens]EAP76981.1 hypothetical protein ISM_01790 [Roseovarius nubinhibens ISM]